MHTPKQNPFVALQIQDDACDDDDFEAFGEFGDIFLDNYEQYRQITFFVPNNESTYTLEELTEILI